MAARRAAAAKQLVAFVHVDGQVYGPGDDVPAAVAKQITNPKAWSSDSTEDADDTAPTEETETSEGSE